MIERLPYLNPIMYGAYGWWRAWECVAMVTLAGLAATLCRERWAWA